MAVPVIICYMFCRFDALVVSMNRLDNSVLYLADSFVVMDVL